MTKKIRYLFQSIANFFFPCHCLGCGKPDVLFCDKCLRATHYSPTLRDKNISVAADYNDPIIKKAVWFLKYKGIKTLAKPLAELVYQRVFSSKSTVNCEISVLEPSRSATARERPVASRQHRPRVEKQMLRNLRYYSYFIIPIPLSTQRFRERGFNQAELLARHLSDKLSQDNPNMSFKVLTDVLFKKIHTDTQVSITDKKRRLKNMVGTFEIKNSHFIAGKKIILMDDITTTGATFSEAKKVLHSAGAKKIICVAIARG